MLDRWETLRPQLTAKKTLTHQDTGAPKSVIGKSCIEKPYIAKSCSLHMCTGIYLSSVSGIKITPRGQITLKLSIEKFKLTQIFIVCKNLTRPLISGLDYTHKFPIGTDWETQCGLFLHRNGPLITHPIKSLNCFHNCNQQNPRRFSHTQQMLYNRIRGSFNNGPGESNIHN